MSLSVLIVDDDDTIRETLVDYFTTLGHVARGAATGDAARRMAAEHAPDVTLLDLRLPDADGITVLEALLADDPELGVVILSGHADVPTAVRAMRLGAADVLEKPVELGLLGAAAERAAERGRLRREVAMLRSRDLASRSASSGILDAAPLSPPTLEQVIGLAARHPDAPVLLQGETGTGKGFVARMIHDRSDRNRFPFVEINCSSLSPAFFESELFGHERGAFTDARQAKRGLIEVAGAGSLFLDEIAEMSLDVQPRLLKVIEERTFRRLGGTTMLRADARIILATNRPLPEAVANGRFREDLFYRLQVLTITLPPLRESPERVAALAEALLPRDARLDPSAMRAMVGYAWPGNIRELRNALWRAAILADGSPIRPEHLGIGDGSPAARGAGAFPEAKAGDVSQPVATLTLEEAERRAVDAALRAEGGNRTRAARRLGIARSTLQEKLRRYPELA